MKKKIASAAAAFAIGSSLMLGGGVAEAKPAPKAQKMTPLEQFSCGFWSSLGLHRNGGPKCRPVKVLARYGPYANEAACERDEVRQVSRQPKSSKAFRGVCYQARSGFYYMRVDGYGF